MELAAVGISHKEADLDLRGQLSLTTSKRREMYQHFIRAGIKEVFILNTCNRLEVYIASKQMGKDLDLVRDYFIYLGSQKVRELMYTKKHEVALQHLFQVATGLQSQILGEDQIAGQFKRTLEEAIEIGASRKYLAKAVREALHFSKKVRTAFRFGENSLSVASIAMKQMKQILGDLTQCRILLIGTGELGQLVLRYLEAEKVQRIYICNRTCNPQKENLLLSKEIHCIDYEERYAILSEIDVVIGATASPHQVIQKDKIKELLHKTLFVDLAVPRDIDPQIKDYALAQLLDMDGLQKTLDENLLLRQEQALQINRLIHEEVKDLELWILRSRIDGILQHLKKQQQEEVKKALEEMEAFLIKGEDQQKLVRILEQATYGMIAEPIRQLKLLRESDEMDEYKRVLEHLYQVEEGENY